jgi:hypothetical protein
MKKFLVLAFTLILSACTTPSERNQYQGADAGRVAIGIGAAAKTTYSSYTFLFRKIGDKEVNRFSYFQDNFFSAQKRDYQSQEENGVVQYLKLPPGNYEIFNFSIAFITGNVDKHFSSHNDFSIPFMIRSNETTYLGNYQANKLVGRNIFGLPLPAGAVFVVSDREENDLKLVEKRSPEASLLHVSNFTPSPTSIANSYFINASEFQRSTL